MCAKQVVPVFSTAIQYFVADSKQLIKVNSFRFHQSMNSEHISEWNNEQTLSSGVPMNSTDFYYESDDIAITFENCQFNEIRFDFIQEFHNLLTLNISNVEWEKHQSKYLRNATKLTTLIASNNRLTKIAARLFINADQIISVDFTNNNIKQIKNVLEFQGKFCMIAACICVIIAILSLAFLNHDRLCNFLHCQESNYQYNTLLNRTVKYSNGHI